MNLTVEVDDELLVLASLLGDLVEEDLLEIDGLCRDDSDM